MQRWQIAEAIYKGRMHKAWGASFKNQFPNWRDPKVLREYPHHPIAEIDLALASADEVINLIELERDADAAHERYVRSLRGNMEAD